MEQDIFETIKKYGQEHLIDHYEGLTDPALKAHFLAQLHSIDYQQASQLYQHVYVEREQLKNAQNADFAPVSNIATHEDLKLSAAEFDQIGFEAIGRGEGR
jgi:vesicle coat complex subunit